MASFQQTIIIGNCGRDPNFKYTQSGIAVCDVSVAVTKKSGGKEEGSTAKESTTWFRVTFWREQAEIANQYIRKGSQLMVVGTIAVNPYIDKNNTPAATLDLTSTYFQLLGNRDSNAASENTGGDSQFPADVDLSDIPF